MTRESLVFVIGLLVFLTPFLGIPEEWKEYVFIAAGALLMIVGFMLRRAAFFRSIENAAGERESDAFAESTGYATGASLLDETQRNDAMV